MRSVLIYTIGDVSPEDHGGGALVRTGAWWTLEYTHGPSDDHEYEYGSREERNQPLTIYRVDVATSTEAVQRDLNWCDWTGIASYIGADPWDLFEIAMSDDPRKLAELYEAAASYHGWQSFDEYPIEQPYHAVARRWRGMDEKQRKVRRAEQRKAQREQRAA